MPLLSRAVKALARARASAASTDGPQEAPSLAPQPALEAAPRIKRSFVRSRSEPLELTAAAQQLRSGFFLAHMHMHFGLVLGLDWVELTGLHLGILGASSGTQNLSGYIKGSKE